MEISKLIVRRKELKMSSGDLAGNLKITPATMSKYERGHREPGLKFFEEWLKELRLEMTINIKTDKL